MRIAVPAETEADETARRRDAGNRQEIRRARRRRRGRRRAPASGAGLPDADYEAAGATIAADRRGACADADLVLKVRRPGRGGTHGATSAARIVVAIMDPYGHEAALEGHGQGRASRLSRWS